MQWEEEEEEKEKKKVAGIIQENLSIKQASSSSNKHGATEREKQNLLPARVARKEEWRRETFSWLCFASRMFMMMMMIMLIKCFMLDPPHALKSGPPWILIKMLFLVEAPFRPLTEVVLRRVERGLTGCQPDFHQLHQDWGNCIIGRSDCQSIHLSQVH